MPILAFCILPLLVILSCARQAIRFTLQYLLLKSLLLHYSWAICMKWWHSLPEDWAYQAPQDAGPYLQHHKVPWYQLGLEVSSMHLLPHSRGHILHFLFFLTFSMAFCRMRLKQIHVKEKMKIFNRISPPIRIWWYNWFILITLQWNSSAWSRVKIINQKPVTYQNLTCFTLTVMASLTLYSLPLEIKSDIFSSLITNIDFFSFPLFCVR